MVESWTHNRKVASSSLGPAGLVGGESECTALALSTFNTTNEPPTAPQAPQHKWLPTAPGVCVHCCVCVHLIHFHLITTAPLNAILMCKNKLYT